MGLPFLFPQSRNFRACNLTPDLKMRYGSDIHIIPEILVFFGSMNHRFIDIWIFGKLTQPAYMITPEDCPI